MNRYQHTIPLLKLWCILLVAFFATRSYANPGNYIVKVKILKDSLIAAENTNLLANKVTIANNTKKVRRIAVRTIVPYGWKNISRNKYIDGDDEYYNISPGEEISVPVNLLKLPTAKSEWAEVKFKIWYRELASDTQEAAYSIRTKERKTFVTQPKSDIIEVDKINTAASFKTYLKNTGNIEDTYVLKYKNYELNIDDSVIIKLQPGKDSNYTHEIKLNHYQIANVNSETITFNVTNSIGQQYNNYFQLQKYAEEGKYNRSSYSGIPLRLEMGAISFGERTSIYGAARGRIQFKNARSFEFTYRSKQFGNMPTGLQQHIFKLQYNSKNLTVTAGQVNLPLFFVTNPIRGLDVTYNLNGVGISLIAVMRDGQSYFQNDVYAAILNYSLKKATVNNTLMFNTDHGTGINSYISSNDVVFINKKNITFNILARAGYEENPRNQAAPKQMGISGGYGFRVSKNKITFSSTANYYDKRFPGINRGLIYHNHDITLSTKKSGIGLFYSSSYMMMNFLRDSLFNSDLLSYNIDRLGIRYNKFSKSVQTSISTGLLKQNGLSFMNGGLKTSYFLDVLNRWQMGNKWTSNLNIQSAFGDDPTPGKEDLFIITSTADISSKYFGFMMLYTRTPITGYEDGKQTILSYTETVNGGPNVNFYLFRSRLHGTVRYNLSKSLKDNFFTSGVGGSLGYTGPKSGFSINASCFMPFRSQTDDPGLPIANRRTAQLAISKQLHVPVLFNKKYHTLKLVLFNDVNNNQSMDADEMPVENVKMTINNMPFISNGDGEIKYKNIEKGDYHIHVQTNNENLVPINGINQIITVDNNITFTMPFKKGKEITGTVRIISDSFSTSKLSPDQIKITAVDSVGIRFSTLTDKQGNFKLSVPAGVYNVRISQSFLENSDYKAQQSGFKLDLVNKEKENVVFVLKQKARKVRYLENK